MNEQPNILFVLSDQHLATCMGCEGHSQAITPNMDRLAREGVRFRHAYTQNPICTPSRVSMLSGQYCHNHGVYGLSGPVPPKLPSFLGHLKAGGYRTAMIGKLHMPEEPEDWPRRDVDVWLEGLVHGDELDETNCYYGYLHRKGLMAKADHVKLPEFPGAQQHEARPSALAFEDSIEGWSAQEGIRFMEECGTTPFCVQVSLFRPHQCYTPAQQFWDMYPDDIELPPTFTQDASGRPPHFQQKVAEYRAMKGLIEPTDFESLARRVWRGYLACITHCDHTLGLLLDYLEKSGKAENTIVVYTSDHGAYSGTYGIPEKAPGICSEAVCRVPMIWRGPGITSQGNASNAFAELVDLAPTFCSLAGVPAMESADGKDLSILLRGDEATVREVAVTELPWSKSLRWRNWRFVHYQPEMFGGEDVGELYDIDSDENETRNLYHEPAHRETVAECRRKLLEWLIRSTRHVSAWTPPRWPELGYPLAGDGKEATLPGIPGRVQQGMLNYI